MSRYTALQGANFFTSIVHSLQIVFWSRLKPFADIGHEIEEDSDEDVEAEVEDCLSIESWSKLSQSNLSLCVIFDNLTSQFINPRIA